LKREEKFAVLQGEIDGRPLLAIIDKSLREYESKAGLPWFLSISTPLINPTKDGLPNDKDSSALNAWEDLLESAIAAACRFVYVGHVTWNGSREVLYYVAEPDALDTRLKNLVSDRVTRPFAFHYERDDKWDRISIYFKQ